MLKILITVIITQLTLSLYAQPHTKQEGVECNLRSIDTLLSHKSIYQSLHISPELTSVDVEDVNRWAADMLESEFEKSGLEVSAEYDYRFWDDAFVNDDYDGDENIPYKQRFLVSLKWNIMQSGLIDKDNFRQRVDILSRTQSQEIVNNTIKYLVEESAERQMSELYGYYNVLVEAKAELYSVLIEMQEELVANNKATILSLSDLKIKRANVLRMRKGDVVTTSGVIDLENYLAGQSQSVGNEYDSLVESNNSILQNKLEQELNLNEVNGVSYWKEVRVSPFVRVYNYLDEQTHSKFAGKIGVSSTFPIFTNTKAKRNEMISRGKLLANEEQYIRKDISLKVKDLLRQLNENLTTLQVLAEGIKHYNEGCSLATQYYNNKTMTIQELGQRYIDNLDNNIEIYKLIMEREELKYRLFNVVYGV